MRRLLIRPGAIGDVILSLPALEALRADYTEVWAPREVLPLIRFADRTRPIIETGLDSLGVREGHSVPALASFESIHSWYGSANQDFRAAVRGLPFTFHPALPPPPGVPSIPVPQPAREDFVVLHPFASSVRKRWPLDLFQELAKRCPLPVRWCVSPGQEGEAIDGAVRIADLYQLACWLATAKVYVGNDSGISHLAAAVGTPTLAIFLDTDPQIWAPRGAHTQYLWRPTVEDVLDRIAGILG